jgi:hypothetical protein
MKGPFGEWLVHELVFFGIPLQNRMIPFVGGSALYCLLMWHINRP